MKCLCDTDMVETTDFGSGDMREFLCPTCFSSMILRRDVLEEYSANTGAADTLAAGIRAAIADEVRRQLQEASG